ncbi:S26 family signal peptidase [Bacillus sp. J14TS2]|uniref:signal peptidase I SipW n=1 Tax=Bacillus sp. J14TS2 TaxID=2807188 RepID=UPI001B19D40C|nr:signal peptidase I [Bacillus sp. J14TS2]GIN71387.1 S26 family signal peptidase [Bacillus sp. J14TS2]
MKGKTILKWLGNSITTLFIMLLVCAVFVVISSRAAGGEPSLFGYQLKAVLSGSMEPEMPVGSIILVQLTDENSTFTNGDVITFRTDENILITHRILEIENGGQRFITKGDNNNGPDVEPVMNQNIVGKYSGVAVPYVGYIFHYLNTKQGAFLLLFLPGLFFLGHALFTIWRALRLIESPNESKLTEE